MHSNCASLQEGEQCLKVSYLSIIPRDFHSSYKLFGYYDGSISLSNLNNRTLIWYQTNQFNDPVSLGDYGYINKTTKDVEENLESYFTIGNQNEIMLYQISKHEDVHFCGYLDQIDTKLRNRNQIKKKYTYQDTIIFPQKHFRNDDFFNELYVASILKFEDGTYRIEFLNISQNCDWIQDPFKWNYNIFGEENIVGSLNVKIEVHGGNFTDSQLRVEDAPQFRYLLLLYDDEKINIFEIDKSDQDITFSHNFTDPQFFYKTASRSDRLTDVSFFGDHVRRVNLTQTDQRGCSNAIAGLNSQVMWIAIGIESSNSSSTSYLRLISFPEFGEFTFRKDHDSKSIENPAHLEPGVKTKCSSWYSQWFWRTKEICTDRMEYTISLQETPKSVFQRWRGAPPHQYQGFEGTSPIPHKNIEESCGKYEQVDSSLYHSCREFIEKQNQLANNPDQGCIGAKYALMAEQNNLQNILYHTIFIQHENIVKIFALQPHFCREMSNFLSEFNEIDYGNSIVDMDVSENSQHLMVSTKRWRYEIDSYLRLQEICKRLKHNPDDPFLQSFKTLCQSDSNGPLVDLSFLYYTSLCLPGTYCPSTMEELLSGIDSGYYTPSPIEIQPCEPGHYCYNGTQRICPPGFMCPEIGMDRPAYCPTSSLKNLTCLETGLDAPTPCPPGQICKSPSLRPVAAPPGTYIYPIGPRDEFKQCITGEYCPLGRYSHHLDTSNMTELLCPANTYCSNPDIIQPTICECEQAQECFWCPQGTSTPSLCEAGYRCSSPSQREECALTQWCPSGTIIPGHCPKGFYCPEPSEANTCSSGHFCAKGVVTPQKCPPLSSCPEGTTQKPFSFLWLFVFLVVVLYILWIMVSKIYHLYYPQNDDSEGLTQPSKLIWSNNFEKCWKKTTNDYVNIGERQSLTKQGVSIKFSNLSFRLIANNSCLLQPTSATLGTRSVNAIMGPSGAGKSTLLKALSGRGKFSGKTKGTIQLVQENGKKIKMDKNKNMVGYVPQEDIMHPELTVYENVFFSAMLRTEKTTQEIQDKVGEVLRLLDIYHVRGSKIGFPGKEIISGGERKRVNIGMELVTDPTILFLDEPTSGLDSSTSEKIVDALDRMATEKSLTILTVIHQPSWKVVTKFHNILLLASGGKDENQNPRGGKLVYFGPPRGLWTYFVVDNNNRNNQNGILGQTDADKLKPDSDDNLADFLMEKIATVGEQLPLYQHNDVDVDQDAEHIPSEDNNKNNDSRLNETNHEFNGNNQFHKRIMKNLQDGWHQFFVFTIRAIHQQFKTIGNILMDLALVVIAGGALGLVFRQSDFRGPPDEQIIQEIHVQEIQEALKLPMEDPIITMSCLSAMAVCLTGITASMKIFGSEKLMFERESNSGTNTFSYFMGKNIAHIPYILISPLAFMIGFYNFVAPRVSFGEYYGVILLLKFASCGIGYLFSVFFNLTAGQLAGVVFILACTAFSGLQPTLKVLQDMFFPVNILPHLSIIRWGQEALYLSEIKYWKDIYDLEPALKALNYSYSDYGLSLGIIVLFGVIFRLFAFLALWLSTKPTLKRSLLRLQGMAHSIKSKFEPKQ